MENIFPQQYEYISYKQKETLKLNLLVRERHGELTEAEKEQLEEYVKTHKTDSEKERRKNILQLKQSLKGMKITADDKRSMRNKLQAELEKEPKKNQEDLKELLKEIEKL